MLTTAVELTRGRSIDEGEQIMCSTATGEGSHVCVKEADDSLEANHSAHSPSLPNHRRSAELSNASLIRHAILLSLACV